MLIRKLLIAFLVLGVAFHAAAQGPDARTLVIAQSVDATRMDPADTGSRPEANIAAHLWGSLVKTTSDGDLTPYFATDWRLNDVGNEITFTLRQDIVCHDGEPFTAVDAAYSFNRAKDPAFGFTGNTPGFIFSSLGFVEARAVAPYEVTIEMERRNPIALGLIGEVYVHCMASYINKSKDEAALNPVGSGPYRFVEWIRDDRMVLERVADYPLAVEGAFDRIIWRVIPEASTRAAELMAGNVDIVANISPDQAPTINASGRANVQAVAGTRRIYVGFNLRDEFAASYDDKTALEAINNVLVRRAINHAVDVESICSQLLGTDCVRATGLVNPPNDNQSLSPYAYDPELAERLLDEAGYPRGANGVRFNIRLQSPNNRYLNDANVALAVGQFLSDVGVNTEVDLLDFSSVYVPLIVGGNMAGPLFLLGSGGATWNALYDMTDLARVDSGTNYTGWSNPAWFDRWADISATTNEAEQRVIIDEMLQVFYDDAPWLMMYFQPDFYGVSTRINWDARRDEKVIVTDATLR